MTRPRPTWLLTLLRTKAPLRLTVNAGRTSSNIWRLESCRRTYQPQPALDEVASINAWIGIRLANIDGTSVRDPGRVTIRRLNRNEYNNTVRDLIGVDYQPADDFLGRRGLWVRQHRRRAFLAADFAGKISGCGRKDRGPGDCRSLAATARGAQVHSGPINFRPAWS